jgi:uncharacterized protein
MAQEHVEIVRQAYEAYARNDIATIERLTHPDLVWQPQEEAPEPGTLHGTQEVLSWLTDWDAQFTDARIEPEEFIDLGDRVVAVSRVKGRGRGSDVDVEMQTAHLFTFRGGRIASVRGFFDRGEALDAAVREPAGAPRARSRAARETSAGPVSRAATR